MQRLHPSVLRRLARIAQQPAPEFGSDDGGRAIGVGQREEVFFGHKDDEGSRLRISCWKKWVNRASTRAQAKRKAGVCHAVVLRRALSQGRQLFDPSGWEKPDLARAGARIGKKRLNIQARAPVKGRRPK